MVRDHLRGGLESAQGPRTLSPFLVHAALRERPFFHMSTQIPWSHVAMQTRVSRSQ